MNTNRPMLACSQNVTEADLKGLLAAHGVLYGTPKLDGIRCRISSEGGSLSAVSRKSLLIPNAIVQMWVEEAMHLWGGLDGEIVIPGQTFHQIQSWVMTSNTMPKPFVYYIFDWEAQRVGYLDRCRQLKKHYKFNDKTRLLLPEPLATVAKIKAFLKEQLALGFEGLILRTADSPYKHGRSTWDEGYMLKMKVFEDSEATILSIHEKQHNNNPATKDDQGLTKRSKHQANLEGAGTLGKFTVRDCASGVVFDIGSGWDAEFAQEVWDNQPDFIGEILTYKHQPHGRLELPRCPTFKGMRYD